MPISDVYTTIAEFGGAGLIVFLLGIIKVKPLEISIWSWLFRKLGRLFNGETLDRLTELEKTLKKHAEDDEKKDILEIRSKILCFADELCDGRYISDERFENMLDLIKDYDDYCDRNPSFPNGRTVMSAKIIKDEFERRIKEKITN